MSKTFTIENCTKVQRGTAMTEILCMIKYKEVPFPVPFWARPDAPDLHSREVYERCDSGEFGEVTFPPSDWPYIPKTQEEWEVEKREERDDLLLKSDWTQTVDVNLSAEIKAKWADYRQKLRDVTKQVGFPYHIEWPEKP